MRIVFFLLGLFLMFFVKGCSNKKPVENNITVTSNNSNKHENEKSFSEVIDLPIKFDSIPILIFPVGKFSKNEKKNFYISKSSDNRTYNNISNHFNDELRGNMSNLLFQKEDSEEFVELTENNIYISKVEFLRELFNSLNQQYLLYTISDSDTNKDENINYLDNTALYISDISGENFKNLSPKNHKLIGYKYLKFKNSLYFKTLEKTNKKEVIHYYKVQFLKLGFKINEYFPFK